MVVVKYTNTIEATTNIMIFTTPAIVFPAIDPVIVSIGSVDIRWYALSYVAGIMLGWWFLGKLNKLEPVALSQKAYDDFIVWAIVGIILGGRLGYVLFYGNLGYYMSNPLEILATWKGGMSFHGGLVGVIVVMYLMCRVYKLQFLRVVDLVAVIAPIGLFLGRIANFLNAELYGRISDVPWAVVFPDHVYARHPSQLYEAILEGVVLFLIMLYFMHKTNARQKAGKLAGIFLIGYAAFRGFVEFFREPDAHIGFLAGGITMGHVLSLPMLLLGIFLVLRAKKCH